MRMLARLLGSILVTVLPALAVLAYERDGPPLRSHIELALVLGVVLGALVALLSQHRLVRRPIERLIACTNALRAGRYSRREALAAGVGEFAPLVRAFDDMAAQLAAREAALRESKATLQSLYDSAPTLMGVVELVGDDILHIYDNPATSCFFGREPGSTEGRLASELVPQTKVISEWVARYREAEARGVPVRFEYRHRAGDDYQYWLMVAVAVIGPGPSGRTRFSYVAEDITERRRAEEALLVSEERFRRLSDASFEGVVIHDWERVIESNAAAAQLFGYEPEEMTGRPLAAFFAPEVYAEALAIARADAEARYESVGLRKDGSTFPMEFRGRRLENGGRPRHIIAIRDLTDQKNAAAALRESEERLALAMAAGGLGTWDLDFTTGRVRLDARLAAMLRLPPDRIEANIDQWMDLIPPEDREKRRAEFRALIEGETPQGIEYRVIRADGVERWHAGHAIVVRRADGTPFRAVGVAQDITERKQAEAHGKLVAAELDHRSKNMLALVQVLLRQTRAATVQDYAAAALGRVAALARAHTLLSESRWEAADLGRLIEEELAPFRRTASQRVHLEGPQIALSPRAAQSFALVFHELATNAVKYGALSAPQGHVSVTWAWRADGWLVLTWMEADGPPVQAPKRRGLGMTVLERSIRNQLEGEVRLDWRPEGLTCELVVRAERLVKTTQRSTALASR